MSLKFTYKPYEYMIDLIDYTPSDYVTVNVVHAYIVIFYNPAN